MVTRQRPQLKPNEQRSNEQRSKSSYNSSPNFNLASKTLRLYTLYIHYTQVPPQALNLAYEGPSSKSFIREYTDLLTVYAS